MKLERLYRDFHTKNKYADLNEMKILTSLYSNVTDTLEVAVSRIINEAVLSHMNLNIDSTIMQMLALNEYLSSMFLRNFEALIYNYLIHYLNEQGIEEIGEQQEKLINVLAKKVDMKTNLEELIVELKQICHLT